MQSSLRIAALVLVVAAIAVAGGYFAGRQQAQEKPAPTADVSTPAAVDPMRGHPPITAPPPVANAAHGKFTHFNVGGNNVKAMLADGPMVWVGTSSGVIQYNTVTNQHRSFDVRSGLLSNGVFHLSKIKGRLAVGTYGGGLSFLDEGTGTWENVNIQHGLGDAFVYDALELDNGDVWIATWSGANRVRGGDFLNRSAWDLFTVENTKGGLPNDWVYGLRAGKNGEVWLATEGGLARYEDGQWQNWKHDDGLGEVYEKVKEQIEFKRDPAKESSHHARQKVEQGLAGVDIAYNPNYVVAIEVDDSGVVWCGTWGGGLARFDGKSWKNFTVSDGLPGNHVFMLKNAGEGKLWVGTSKGLSLFDGQSFTNFGVRDGLFAENVFSMALSQGNEQWVGSFGGVARFEKPLGTP